MKDSGVTGGRGAPLASFTGLAKWFYRAGEEMEEGERRGKKGGKKEGKKGKEEKGGGKKGEEGKEGEFRIDHFGLTTFMAQRNEPSLYPPWVN